MIVSELTPERDRLTLIPHERQLAALRPGSAVLLSNTTDEGTPELLIVAHRDECEDACIAMPPDRVRALAAALLNAADELDALT